MKKILIVEDDPILISTLADNLIKEGFEIIKAVNGEEGLASALAVKPDLILLDILMPKMDGLTVLKKLREDSWGANVPVIILTNLSSPKNISNALEFMGGFQEYLVKSEWEMGDVVAKVHDRLKE
ncbi:MAG: response regulator [Candidatus Pacebacteria bacterium]|nr:response regulator [Candidatus Paceibacterota bacterium]